MKINNLYSYNSNILKLLGKKSILQTRPNSFVGKNISLAYKNYDEYLNLPRFFTKEMREARIMNRFAVQELKSKSFIPDCSKANPKDLVRLIDTSSEANLSRVKWVNPKDGKVYYLLKNGKNELGLPIVRILDENANFVKESVMKKCNIVVCEIDKPDKGLDDFYGLSHSDLTTLFIRKHNPFADVKLCLIDSGASNDEKLAKVIDSDTAAVSCAFGASLTYRPNNFFKRLYYKYFNKKLKIDPVRMENDLAKYKSDSIINFDNIPKNIRVFVSSGNNGKNSYNKYLAFKNVEGVGSLDSFGKVTDYSASRNSYFTQHYELGDFPTMQVPEGFMITSFDGIDVPFKSDKFREIKTLSGTSFSVSIRAAKAVLNQMMEDIL